MIVGPSGEGKKETPKVFSVLKIQVPQQAKRGSVYTKKLVFKGKCGKCICTKEPSRLSVPWSLRPQNRAAAATCGRGRCELPAILRLTPKSLAASDFFAAGEAKKPCDFCSGMVASPLAATMVTAILRCDFCAAKLQGVCEGPLRAVLVYRFWPPNTL